MKLLSIFICILTVSGCIEKPSTLKSTPVSKESNIPINENLKNNDISSYLREFELMQQSEKIHLLSIMYDEPFDSLKVFIGDYLRYSTDEEYLLSIESQKADIVFPIERILKEHTISKKKLASIIFSYKYSIVQDGEILENSKEELEPFNLESTSNQDVVASE